MCLHDLESIWMRGTVQVTLLCGFIQFVAWALRLSFLLQLLSRSIMSGFTTAVSVIFILSQATYRSPTYFPVGRAKLL